MTPSPVQSGHAFEYGIGLAFHQLYPGSILRQDDGLERARLAFASSEAPEQEKLLKAARSAANFLAEREEYLRIREGYEIFLQPDREGILGDVRDIVVLNIDSNVGISAKNRHRAVKHSRLSQSIDFGSLWFGLASSSAYFETIRPIFDELRSLTDKERKWRDLPNKADRFYLPILNAFKDEAVRLCKNPDGPKRMVEYMLGIHDFYKVVKENGSVLIQSFNLHDTLNWGNRLHHPTRLIEARIKDNSKNIVELTFDRGWQLKFRIHNASTLVEPSLKFDIQFIGFPNISQNQIDYQLVI